MKLPQIAVLMFSRLCAAAVCVASLAGAAPALPDPDATGLPPGSVPERIASRPIPEWIQTHLRVGHLPGDLPMAAEFLKAGYNVVTLNVLRNAFLPVVVRVELAQPFALLSLEKVLHDPLVVRAAFVLQYLDVRPGLEHQERFGFLELGDARAARLILRQGYELHA